MRKVLIISVLAILAVAIIWVLFPLGPPEPELSGLCSADNWCWQNPLPQGNTFHSVCFKDRNHGWAVGDYGAIFHTSDGQEWSPQDSGVDEELYDVTFTDLGNGWAVGLSWDSHGTILHTTDGGNTWSKQDSGATGHLGYLYAVTFTDLINGWAVGSSWDVKARILHTTNGGQDWSLQYSGNEGTTLRDVTFIDSQNGWAVGYGCTILHTTGGDGTWVPVQHTSIDNPENLDLESIDLYAVSFIDADNGWATGKGNFILHTTDGGTTWSVCSMHIRTKHNIDYPPDYPFWLFRFRSISFVDSTNGWAVGYSWAETGAILRTTDGGITWIDQTGWPLDAWNHRRSAGYGHLLHSVTFLDTNEGSVVGSGGAIFHTADGGYTWVEQTHHVTRVNLKSAAFYTPIVGFAVGDNGVLVRTNDGITWNQHNPDISGHCHYKSIALTGSHVWVVGFGSVNGEAGRGRIFHSANAGVTWTEETSITDAHGNPLDLEEIELLSVIFVDETTGWVAGKSGIILHTSDGGNHWVRQESGITDTIESLAFVDTTNGWAVGWEPTDGGEYRSFILHTNDGGIHWTQQESGTTDMLRDITFINDQTGWAVGDGTILHTSDGGQNWNAQVSVPPCQLLARAVTFADGDNGWVVTFAGRIFRTTDGGESWCREHSGTSNTLWDVVFTNTFAPEVWAVGWNGTILHYSEE